MINRTKRAFWAAFASVAALALVFSVSFSATRGKIKAAENAVRPVADLIAKNSPIAEQVVSPTELSSTFRKVAKAVGPAVVNIRTVEKVNATIDIFPSFPGWPSPHSFNQRGNGSGVIVTEDGYILTNNHVVGKADAIEVKLADGSKYKGRLIGSDPQTDIAVIKIDVEEGKRLPKAVLGDSDAIEQGDWVIAIGSPFGLEQTITAGIVSAKGRRVGASQYNNFIQTDASINPGNSGGPLVNMKGEVIGINTMIFSETGANQGIGFAVPSRLANSIYKQIVSKGKVVRGYLGVIIEDLTPEMAKGLGLKSTAGALINDVQPSSPAATANLQPGDVIVGFDGKEIRSGYDLTSIVAETPVGKNVEVKYERAGKIETASVVVAQRPDDSSVGRFNRAGFPDSGEESVSKLGFFASDLSAEQAANLRIKSGVFVERVEPGSPAYEAGLRPADVIHRINRTEIRSVADLADAVKSLKKGDTVILQVESRGQLRFLTITVE
ncbi:MAG: Do family serine endopeptidase [Acidobacteriota bacterium]|nr:Do family serine endopeptidase [Blastocatellia bacterium]MDW8412604.1 Do family serine endopeptidase [Acidobacteriota bacterium]